jgi:3D (Asp-Asp-Asp) domain-containing protein
MLSRLVVATLVAAAVPAFASPTANDREMSPTLKLRATLYTVALESDFPAHPDANLLSRDGTVLHRASKKFLRDAALQGSGRLNDGRIVMVTPNANGLRWKISPYDYVIGANGCPLTPFRSASVDKRVIPLGTKLIIPETAGMELPDGTIHDGVWYAVDTGGAIKHDRVDLFVGPGKAALGIPKRFGIGHLQKLTVTLAGRTSECPA